MLGEGIVEFKSKIIVSKCLLEEKNVKLIILGKV